LTSVDVPYSIAAALPTLSVLDITNDVAHEISDSGLESGIAYVAPVGEALVRASERENGFFCDLEALLDRLVPLDTTERTRLVSFLLGPRTEQVPFADGRLCLGQWQRLLLFGFDERPQSEWTVTLLG
jgi:thiamine phosphate synthase YjbQ (UPF0047 family)